MMMSLHNYLMKCSVRLHTNYLKLTESLNCSAYLLHICKAYNRKMVAIFCSYKLIIY